MTLLIVALACCCFWWAQRDTYRRGIEMGRAMERHDQLMRALSAEKKHLTVVK
jgi:hypothetical protein